MKTALGCDVLTKERIKQENRRKRKRTFSLIKAAALFLLCAVGLFFLLNDLFFHINGVPSSADVVRFFGGGPKLCVELKSGEASVSFIDVGQGDCELIRVNGINILIDSGEADRKGAVAGFLRYSGVERIDIAIASHPHSDHYGAMPYILNEFEVGLFLMPELPDEFIPWGVEYEKLLTVIADKGINARYITSGERFELGEDSCLEILSPLYYDYDELNDFSAAVRFVHGETSFLFTGDMQEASERDLVESGAFIDSDVLKVGHHGSAGSGCAELLNAVTPDIAVIEAAAYNYYGHPRTAVIERLFEAGCGTVYSTANNGNIVVVSDGENIRVEVEKEQALILGE